MSDARVSASLDDLDRLLGTLMDDPNPEAVAEWHASFKEALAGAEKGPQWLEISTRAKMLGSRLDERVNQLQALRGAVREELLAREKGRRALSGYSPS
jgi:flagellar hook-associated protein FlgK